MNPPAAGVPRVRRAAEAAPVRVALIGANGHGRWHRRTMAPLHAAGRIDLVALCDLAPVRDEPDAPMPAGTRVFDDYRALLAATMPEVVVICTPPHTHLEIATAAARAGADLLLEKPPLTNVDEQVSLQAVLDGTGRVCQVGFQALGSAALAELIGAIDAGQLGEVTAVSAVGAWQRPDAYYQRAPWAGRRRLAGQPVLDGALANPFAHALMHCLALGEAATGEPVEPVEIELERYHARPIEVDDTSVLRLRAATGLRLVVAVSLCGDEFIAGEVIVHGERGRAVLGYTQDWLRLPGDAAAREVPGRAGLLENLLDHRAAPAEVPLLVPLHRTGPFTALIEAIAGAPEPAPISARHQRAGGVAGERTVTVPGASELLRRSAQELALPSELAASWAAKPYSISKGVQTARP